MKYFTDLTHVVRAKKQPEQMISKAVQCKTPGIYYPVRKRTRKVRPIIYEKINSGVVYRS